MHVFCELLILSNYNFSRLIACDLLYSNKSLRIIGLYVPSRDRSNEKILRKKNFCIHTADYIQSLSNIPSILCGDFNILDRNHVPHYASFLAWEYNFYDFFHNEGFFGAFAHCYPKKQEYSWVGRTNDGYRYDYIFVSTDLIMNINDCQYLHETRTGSLTDHSAVMLKMKV